MLIRVSMESVLGKKITVKKIVDDSSTQVNKLFSNLPPAYHVFTSNIFGP